MYVGHAAIALALKSREPRVPIVPLVLASYGPDWLETALGLFRGRSEMGLYTHYIPGVIAGAVLAAGLYALVLRRPGALMILAAWLLHWPADFFTAHKGLLAPHDRIGLDLYNLPAADFVLESVVVVACCALYARAFVSTPQGRRWVVGMATTLVALQGLLDYGFGSQSPVWSPSLARGRRRPHLVGVTATVQGRPWSRMALALSRPTNTPASEQWRRTAPVA